MECPECNKPFFSYEEEMCHCAYDDEQLEIEEERED